MKRLRWITLLTGDADGLRAEVVRRLGLSECSYEAEVDGFGISSALFPIGRDRFLEVCGPVVDDCPAARRLRGHGQCVYMAIVQVDELESHRHRLRQRGTRIVLELDEEHPRGRYRSIHLHPRDTGAALLSFDVSRPPEDFVVVDGPWRDHVRTGVVDDVVGMELTGPDEVALGRRWAEVLDVDLHGDGLRLDDAVIRFRRGASPERVDTILLHAADRRRVGEEFELAGTRVELV
jgi:hypothetical protein